MNNISIEFPTEETMIVSRKDIFGNGPHSMEMPRATDAQLEAFANNDGKIQDVFPKLNADQREFMLNGILPEKFEEIHRDVR
jgi:hypothetical protein